MCAACAQEPEPNETQEPEPEPATVAATAPSTAQEQSTSAPQQLDLSDEDNDGLMHTAEVAGWEIFVDRSGWGPRRVERLWRAHVSSDPLRADTDQDGLSDAEEFRAKTDPRNPDTDQDGLSDAEELLRWGTDPLSVDTDGDALILTSWPDAALFDGAELALVDDPLAPDALIPGPGATSPSLRDSDADGVGDAAERVDPMRRAAIAELPIPTAGYIDALTVWLLDAQGNQYGGELITSEHVPRCAGSRGGPCPVSVSEERARLLLQELARARSSRWVEARVHARVRLRGERAVPYRVEGLFAVVRSCAERQTSPTPTQAAELEAERPSIPMLPETDSAALGFAGSPPPALAAQWLRNPQGLCAQIGFRRLTLPGGQSLDVETMTATTARLRIEDGALGRSVQVAIPHRDGIRAGTVLETMGIEHGFEGGELIGLGDREQESALPQAPDLSDPPYPEGVEPGPRRYLRAWRLEGQRARPWREQDIVQAGQEVVLRYAVDEDRDGLTSWQEARFGSSDAAMGSDADAEHPQGDGLSDFFETQVGWQVILQADARPGVLPPEPYQVWPHPGRLDSDEDGFDDMQEYQAGTDPLRPDTDGDTVPDSIDPRPLRFANDPPSVSMELSDNEGRLVTAFLAVEDPQNNLTGLTVDWGYGAEPEFVPLPQDAQGLIELEQSHFYEANGEYTVTVSAVDVFGARAEASDARLVLDVPRGALFEQEFDTDPLPDRCRRVRDRHGGMNACNNNNSPVSLGLYPSHGEDYTWSFWVFVTEREASGYLFGSSYKPYFFVYSTGRLSLNYSLRSEDQFSAPGDFTHLSGVWNHIAVSFDGDGSGTNVILYLNGQVVDSGRQGEVHRNLGCLLMVGGARDAPDSSCPRANVSAFRVARYYDDVRIYDRVLSAEEILLLRGELP